MAQVITSRRRVRIEIDLNARDREGLVPAYLSDADGDIALGDTVTAYESEDEVAAPAVVVKVEHGAAFLEVDWAKLDDDRRVTVPVVVAHGSMVEDGASSSSPSGAIWARVKMRSVPLVAAAAAVGGVLGVSTVPTTTNPAPAMRHSSPLMEAGDTA